MQKGFLVFAAFPLALSSCGIINETFDALECNRQAIEMSTEAICENIQAIEAANRSIEENRRQLDAINAELRKAGES